METSILCNREFLSCKHNGAYDTNTTKYCSQMLPRLNQSLMHKEQIVYHKEAHRFQLFVNWEAVALLCKHKPISIRFREDFTLMLIIHAENVTILKTRKKEIWKPLFQTYHHSHYNTLLKFN